MKAPAAVLAWDEVADQYDRFYDDPLCAVENHAVARMLRRAGLLPRAWEVSPVRHVLDLGSGTGLFSDLAQHEDARVLVTGVDGSSAMVSRADEKHPYDSWVLGDMREPPQVGPVTGIVSLFGSLSYIPDPAVAVARVNARSGSPVFVMLYGKRHQQRHKTMLDGRFAGVPTWFYGVSLAQYVFSGILEDLRVSYFSCQLVPRNWPRWAHELAMRMDPWLARWRLGHYVIVQGRIR